MYVTRYTPPPPPPPHHLLLQPCLRPSLHQTQHFTRGPAILLILFPIVFSFILLTPKPTFPHNSLNPNLFFFFFSFFTTTLPTLKNAALFPASNAQQQQPPHFSRTILHHFAHRKTIIQLKIVQPRRNFDHRQHQQQQLRQQPFISS